MCTGGGFLHPGPGGGGAYLLNLALRGWDAARATETLKTCRRAMKPGAHLVVIDYVLPERAVEGPREGLALVMDLHMFVLFGARERTEKEIGTMLRATGFRLERVAPSSPQSTLVGTAV